MKIKESNFVEALSHRNERALEYVMVHYGGLVKSVVHRYLNVLSQYEEECMNDVFFAVWEHIDSYDSARNPFANWIGGIARLKALDYKRKYANHLLETIQIVVLRFTVIFSTPLTRRNHNGKVTIRRQSVTIQHLAAQFTIQLQRQIGKSQIRTQGTRHLKVITHVIDTDPIPGIDLQPRHQIANSQLIVQR